MRLKAISIVIPVKDEKENISVLAGEIKQVMEIRGDIEWECIWVDDGSCDDTFDVLKSLNLKDSRNKFISFKRNIGQSAALWVGINHSSFDIIGTIDGDGQNDPLDFLKMMDIVEREEADFVTGYRVNRKDSLKKKISSKIANFFRTLITGKSVKDAGCSLRVFKKSCIEGLPAFLGLHRFLPTLVKYRGFKIKEVPVNHRPRLKGVSKYNISNRLWVGILDLIGIWWYKKRTFKVEIKDTRL